MNELLYEDPYKPPIYKQLLNGWDNYQIYSIFAIDQTSTITSKQNKPFYYCAPNINAESGISGSTCYWTYTTNQLLTRQSSNIGVQYIAFQRYAPEKIEINFDEIVRSLFFIPNNYLTYKYFIRQDILSSITDRHFSPNSAATDLNITDTTPLYSQADANNAIDSTNQYSAVNFTSLYSSNFTENGVVGTLNYRYTALIQHLYTVPPVPPIAPDVKSLFNGYIHDNRTKRISNPIIIPTKSGKITIKYYRINELEPIRSVTSLDWLTYEIQLVKGKEVILPLVKAVFGTVIIKGELDLVDDVKFQLSETNNNNEYNWDRYYFENVSILIAEWIAIYQAIPANPQPPDINECINYTNIVYQMPIMRMLAANNNHWHNDYANYQDLNVILNDRPLFTYSDLEERYKWFNLVSQSSDGSLKQYGNLIMDSTRTIEIHAALEASKYSQNPLDNTQPRVTNLGHLVEKIAFLLGYRPEPDGTFTKAKEDKRLRKMVSSSKEVDPKKIGVNNFGEDGMILKRLNNRFKGNEIVNDECVVVKDLIQYIAEFHDQDNLAFGIQESSAIEINNENGRARYNNQLELLVDLITIVKDSQDMIRAALVSGLVTQGQTSEIIAGIGLPSVTKTIPIKLDGKNTELPYKGIAPHRSLSQEIATCTYNVGIVTGQLI